MVWSNVTKGGRQRQDLVLTFPTSQSQLLETQLTLKLQGPDIPYAKNKLQLKTKRYGIYNVIILFMG